MRRRALWIVAAVALVAVVVVGLSQAPESKSPSAPAAKTSVASLQKELAGAPAPLAALHRQSAQVLDGGRAAYRTRLASLKGHPVVVNIWAAWCGPCRVEFPVMQQASVRHGRTVAFLGLDLKDNRDAAERLLAKTPLAFPSYEDPDGRQYQAYGLQGTPTTIFFDARGRRTYIHQGPYTDAAQIDDDIRRYATT